MQETCGHAGPDLFVVADQTDFLDRLLDSLDSRGVRFCALGGQGVKPMSIRWSASILTSSLRRIDVEPSRTGCTASFKWKNSLIA